MTSEKLLETLVLILKTDEALGLQEALSQIQDSLANLTNSPAATQYQSLLATALTDLSDGAHQLTTQIKPIDYKVLEELGGAEFFDPLIAQHVRAQIERNAMTPSVARDFVRNLTSRRQSYLNTVTNTVDGLKTLLRSEAAQRQVNSVEAAFQIPRDIFDNKLGEFSKEIRFINGLLEHMGEAQSGELPAVFLETLSSSDPTIAVTTGLNLLKLLGGVVNSFLDVWAKVQKMREVREQVKELGLSKTATKEMEETIVTTIDEVVEESIKITFSDRVSDSGRGNELANLLRNDFNRLYGQIERGLTIEIKTNSDAVEDEKEKEELAQLSHISERMIFPTPSIVPMLLANAELLEGEIQHSKTTRKTTKTERTSAGRKFRDDE